MAYKITIGTETGTVRQRMINLLEKHPMGARDLSQTLGVSEKDAYTHLVHIRRSVSAKGKRLDMTPCECLSCGYIFRDRNRVEKPGRCPRCRKTHILGARFRVV